MSEQVSNRRWFLVVVPLAVVAIVVSWLAWNLYWMHKRELMLHTGGVSYVGNLPPNRDLPWVWKLFGARSIGAVNIDPINAETHLDEYKYAFPEAFVTRQNELEIPAHLKPDMTELIELITKTVRPTSGPWDDSGNLLPDSPVGPAEAGSEAGTQESGQDDERP